MEKPEIIYIAQTNPGQLGVVNANYPGAVRYVRQEELSERKHDSICEVIKNRRAILIRSILKEEYADEDTRLFWEGKINGYNNVLRPMRRERFKAVVTTLYDWALSDLCEAQGKGEETSHREGLLSAYSDTYQLLTSSEKSINIEL